MIPIKVGGAHGWWVPNLNGQVVPDVTRASRELSGEPGKKTGYRKVIDQQGIREGHILYCIVLDEELQQASHCCVRLRADAGATNRGFSQCVTHSRGISVCVTVSLCPINNVSLVTVNQTRPVG